MEKSKGGAIPFGYKLHGAPHDPIPPDADKTYTGVARAILEKRYKGRPRTDADRNFEARKLGQKDD